jgi:hypothetical protein
MVQKTGTFGRYVAISLASASGAAVLMAAIRVGSLMIGYRGKEQPSGTPVPFVEAWTDVPPLAGLVFVVTFLVLVIWLTVRSLELPRSPRRPN